ncbi:MAG: hypothetical protein KGI54_15380 [Pseudomonadota bacterium]|nr:hypothetical protein [Pseudomonadota bacterium]
MDAKEEFKIGDRIEYLPHGSSITHGTIYAFVTIGLAEVLFDSYPAGTIPIPVCELRKLKDIKPSNPENPQYSKSYEKLVQQGLKELDEGHRISEKEVIAALNLKPSNPENPKGAFAFTFPAHAMKESNPENPKDAIASSKLPLHLWPSTATALGSLALLDGALKYGRNNFRAVGVRASVYTSALLRHLMAYYEGEDIDPESGISHLGHILACAAILVEAEAAGNLNDDRAYPTNYREWLNKLTPLVDKIKENHQDKNPKHYTIKDKP